jgi:hypothetical protein
MRGLVHLHLNQITLAEQYFLQLFKIDMDILNMSYFVYDFYKQKLKNTVLLVNSTTNNSIKFSKSYLMPLIKACNQDFEPGKKYLLEWLDRIVGSLFLESNGTSDEDESTQIEEWFQVYFWVVFYLYESQFYADITSLFGQLISGDKYNTMISDLDMEKRKHFNLNEIYFYIGFSFFKLREFSKASDVFDNYSFASNNFNLIALYKILIGKISILSRLNSDFRSRDDYLSVQDEINLKGILADLIRFHDEYDFMFKNVSFFYYKNNNLVSLDELKFHIGEIYYAMDKYDSAYENLKDYDRISGIKFKISFERNDYSKLFYRTLHRTKRFEELYTLICSVKNPGDDENYLKGSCYFYKPLMRNSNLHEFFSNKEKALECLELVRNKEYTYYQDCVYLKLKCLFCSIMKCYKDQNLHEMNVLVKQYCIVENEFFDADKKYSFLAAPSEKQKVRLAYFKLQVEFFAYNKKYGRILSKLYCFYFKFTNKL